MVRHIKTIGILFAAAFGLQVAGDSITIHGTVKKVSANE